MAIHLRISNKAGYSLLAVMIILLFGVGVYAFGTNNPGSLGHSSGEVEVTVDGIDKTLQQAIDSGDFSKGNYDKDDDCSWTEWSEWANQGAWAEVSCGSGESLEGWDCEWSSNQQQSHQIKLELDTFSCRYVSSGTRARARAFCCS